MASFGKSWESEYDKWKLASPDDLEKPTQCRCKECGCDLFPGEKFLRLDDEIYCFDCGTEWLNQFEETVTDEMAFGE